MPSTHDGTLDTNILLSLVLNQNPIQHEKAKKLVFSSKIWRVSMLTVAEMVFVLEGKRYKRLEICKNLEWFCSLANLRLPKSILRPAMDVYLNHPALSFVDAYLACEAEDSHTTPLWTFDKKLAAQSPAAKLLK